MKFTTIKKTDIKISSIGLGTNAVGGHNLFNNLNDSEGKQLVQKALDLGVTFIDTADIYGKGRSEELISEVITNYPRDKFVIASKGGNEWFSDGTVMPNNSPKYLRKALDNSLKRLKLDYIDLYYLHFLDYKTPIKEAINELSTLKKEGKICSIGISNVTLKELEMANSTNEISAVQLQYNILDRSVEKDIIPYCIAHNISFLAYGPLAFGLLGGKYRHNFKLDSSDWRNKISHFQKEQFEIMLNKVEALKTIAIKKNISISNLSMAWLLTQNGVDAIIPGAKNTQQVAANVTAANVKLTSEDLNEINKIIG